MELQPLRNQGFAIAVFQYKDSALKAIAMGVVETAGGTLKPESQIPLHISLIGIFISMLRLT